jgi:very-short-patch-repair endonuclease
MTEKLMFYGASPAVFEKASLLRANTTPAENILWQRLKRNQLNGFKFRRQHPVANFIADFYCHAAKLVIEVDGETHQSDSTKEYDEGRTYEIENFGIKVIRFKNKEVETEIEKVIDTIRSFLPSSLLNTPDP